MGDREGPGDAPWWRQSWGDRMLRSPLQVFLAVLGIAGVVEVVQEWLRTALLPDLGGALGVAAGTLWLPLMLGVLLWTFVLRPLRNSLHQRVADLTERERQLSTEKSRLEFDARLHRALEMAETESEVLRVLRRGLAEATPDRAAELLLADASDARMSRAVTHEPSGAPPGCGVESPRACPAVRQGTTLEFADSESLDACPQLEGRDDGRCAATCVPVSVTGKAIGVLHTIRPHGVDQSARERRRMESLAARTGARLAMVRVLADTELQAATDPLTGLLNRRTLENHYREIAAQDAPLALAMCDLDHFKKLNDRYGHDTGDRALRLFADVLREAVRPSDLAARFGGEEFVVVLPDCDMEQGVQVIERIRERLARTLAVGEVPAFTVSIGIVGAEHSRDLSELLSAADEAMYAAKGAGRDCIVRADERAAPHGPQPARNGAGH